MFARWLLAHRSLAATVASGTVIAAVLGTTAFLSNGYTAQKMQLDDGAVWIANDARQAVGRANPAVAELNSVVKAQGSDLEVVQSADAVLLVDRTNASLDVIDPTASEAGETVALPPERPEVWIAGSNAVIMAQGTGEVWVQPLADLQSFDPSTPADFTFGRNSTATVDAAGVLYAYGPDTREVIVTDVSQAGSESRRTSVDLPATSRSFSITAVAGQWAVLDRTERRLATADGVRSLGAFAPAASDPVLQSPSETGDAVLVSTRTALLSYPFGGGAPTRLAVGSGSPAPPLVLGRCAFAAWTGSEAWPSCGGDPVRQQLKGISAARALVFVMSGRNAVLSDPAGGAAWAVQQGGERIDNWTQLLAKDDTRQEQENDEDTPPETVQEQEPPVAVDDRLGARPGRATTLPVLLNDYDPNGDVLVIDQVQALPEAEGRVDIVEKGQQLLLTLPEGASGSVSFDYTIDDGRGGSSTARVVVEIRRPDQNSPPVQVRTSKTTVQSGGTATAQVLGDWVDPDGDAMFLESATAPSAEDRVTSKPDGVVLFRDSGTGGELKTVGLSVSDGRASGAGSLAVTVRPAGQVPIIADPFPVQATSGEVITVRPLEHVRGGSDQVRLNAVPAKVGVTVVPSFDKGTFTFVSDRVGTHYLEYVVTDGRSTATGQIRVDVTVPPDASSTPVTIPKTVFVRFRTSQTVDVAGTDIDPAGGLLVLSGVDAPAPASGVRAEVLEQRSVRVTLIGPIDAPLTFGYRVSNGLAEAPGTITVVQIPPPALLQPPIARDDTVTVRVGDTIDIPVLDNDEQPDGEEVTLDPTLVSTVAQGGGLLFASGDRLRYLAPKTVGNWTARYRIRSAGQTADATVTIAVRERNASTNTPPVPAQLTARVFAGETVRIDVPLTGIDADGDSVQLLGQDSNPEKGSVTRVGADFFEYTAGAYSSGTDRFDYTVMDGLGARATGTVRIGISPKTEGARNPVAVDDEVSVRPGRSVTVQVLANDSDPDGGTLSVQRVDANGSQAKAKVIDHRYVQITPPRAEGRYGVVYTIQNDSGGVSSAFVEVTVDASAELARPIVSDTVLTVSDVTGRTSIDVPVLDNVFFADGPVSSLGVSVLPSFADSAVVTSGKRIRVQVERLSQIIPFAVSHPDDPDVRSYGFIRVPGIDDALPQLDQDAPKITVKSEQAVTIDLRDYVVAIGRRTIRLADTTSVKATHANGDKLVVDDHTLVFTSADHYFGPASISFEVTDGDPGDTSSRRATLTLPITVTARDNQPPVFQGAALDLEPGEQRDLDLVRLTTYPYDKDLPQLQYAVSGGDPDGFSTQLNGQRLVVSAAASAATGTTGTVTITVRDAANQGQAARISLRIVPSTKPLAKLTSDDVVAQRGQTTSVDVLANDQAGNPFPGTPLRVVQVRGLDSDIPAGISIVPSADRSRLSVSVGQNVAPVDVNVQYQVQDATGDPSRLVWGNVRISVQDRPDPVSGVTVTEFGDRVLKLSWQPGAANNSAITGFEVLVFSASSGDQISTTACSTSASCPVATPGNGPANAVRLRVVAINGIGRSDPAAFGSAIWSDIIPPPPTALSSTPADEGLRVTWTKPDDSSRASPITYYQVTIGGTTSTKQVDPGDATGTAYSLTLRGVPGVVNGSATAYSVSARNAAPDSLATWNQANGVGTPAGPPISTGAPVPTAELDTRAASLSWSGAFDPNGKTISSYYAVAFTGAAPVCTEEEGGSPVAPSGPGMSVLRVDAAAGTSATFSGLTPDQTYRLVVFAENGQGCTASPIVTVTPRVSPPAVTDIAISALDDSEQDGTYDYRLTDWTTASPSDASSLDYRLTGAGVDSTALQVAKGGKLLTSNGSQYGRAVGVDVRACATYDGSPERICGPWSSFDKGMEPISLQIHDLRAEQQQDLLNHRAVWTWTAIDGGVTYTSIQVSADGGTNWQDVGTDAGSVTSPDYPLIRGIPDLKLKITTRLDTKTRDFSG